MGDHERLVLEVPEPLRKHVGRDPRQGLLQVPEAVGTVEQRLDDQERPAVADALQGGLEWRRGGIERLRIHARSVAGIVAVYSDLQFATNPNAPALERQTRGRARRRKRTWLHWKS